MSFFFCNFARKIESRLMTTTIIAIILTIIVLIFGFWLIQYSQFRNEEKKRQWELKRESQKSISPIRLRAYERLALVLERTQPEHLLMDLDVSQFTVPQLQQRLLQTIRLEFDHNMSQQIYVSEQVWDKIVAARGQMLAFVSAMAMQLPPESTSLDYAKTLLTAYNTNGETANETALHALKEEAAKYGLTLHPKKTRIVKLTKGFTFLKIRYHVSRGKTIKTLVRSGIVRMRRKMKKFIRMIGKTRLKPDDVYASVQSWAAHARAAQSYHAVKNMIQLYDELFDGYRLTRHYWRTHKDIKRKRKVLRL